MKNILITLLGLFSIFATAQMTIKKLDGTLINNGDVINFDVAEDPGAYLGLKIYNSAESEIKVKVKVESITNADGTNVQLCIGNVCLATIFAGSSYPPNFPILIDGNGENGNFDHFLNLNTGLNTSLPVIYNFKFYQINDSGSEIGDSVSFSYRYTSALGVSNFNQLENAGINFKSNVVSDNLEFTTTRNIKYILYDVSGKTLLIEKSGIGLQNIDFTHFNSGFYLISFQTIDGLKITSRILKK
jgi:hypothetical protein